MSATVLAPFTARDGENLALYEWPLDAWVEEMGDDAPPPRAVVLLVHGLGEHASRYEHVARLVVSHFVALNKRPIEGLVMCSPALDAGLSHFQKCLLALTPRFAHKFSMRNGLDSRYISHDPRVVSAYQADPLVHDRISASLGRFIANAGPATIAAAARWHTPTLLMYAGSDRLVNPAGSRRFAQAAAESPQVRAGTVTARCFDNLYHELLNELHPADVFDALQVWLDARF